ncbi:MAG TPA: FAD-dependent oxidoreductase, partial [Candidatus Agrococcus pullicola]|nr:FAD-dependent oxidoreductase [Candidatus Agrococcus pullicola]
SGVLVRDQESGEEFSIAADVIVNTSGPWTDLTNEALGRETLFMGGTKGSHIVLDHPELLRATQGREIFFEHSDGRIVLIYPLKNRVLVGTTDIDADPREPARCTEEEVDYFFDLIAHVFPKLTVTRDDIVFRFSGIRPLPRHEDTAPGFVSRDYRIELDETGSVPVLSLVGGKWTTFRALGEALSDRVLSVLGKQRTVTTAGLAIGGGKGYPATDAARRQWQQRNLAGAGSRADLLVARYGTRAADVWQHIEQSDDRPLAGITLSTGELEWMVRNELVVRLADVVLRRTSLAFTGDATAGVIGRIADALAPLLQWDETRKQQEIETTIQHLDDAHGVSIDTLARN